MSTSQPTNPSQPAPANTAGDTLENAHAANTPDVLPDRGLSVELQAALRAKLQDSPLAVLLDTTGHSRQCLVQLNSGKSLVCRCDPSAPPPDDAAIAVGLAIQFARMGAARRIPIPRGVIAALVRQVDAGDPAATLVWRWLAARGQISAATNVRPALRLVCEEAR